MPISVELASMVSEGSLPGSVASGSSRASGAGLGLLSEGSASCAAVAPQPQDGRPARPLRPGRLGLALAAGHLLSIVVAAAWVRGLLAPDTIFAELLAVPLAASAGGSFVLSWACTPHLWGCAGYLVLNSWSILNNNFSFMYAWTTQTPAVTGFFWHLLLIANIGDGLLVLLFRRLLERRVDVLRAAMGRPRTAALGRAFSGLLLALATLSFLFEMNCHGEGTKVYFICTRPVDVTYGTLTGLFFIVFFWWMVLEIRFLREAVRAAEAAALAASGRKQAECHLAVEAMRELMASLVLGVASTVCRWVVQQIWALSWWNSKATMGKLLVASMVAGQLDACGNVLATLVSTGLLSGEFWRICRRAQAESSRRYKWEQAKSGWRPSADASWHSKVEELAGRGFSLEALLCFYRRLGAGCMPHWDPARHTTSDVVRQAIIPLTAADRCALATQLMNGVPTRPNKMVTHNWGNLFRDLVAAICADALGEEEYGRVARLLDRDVSALEGWLDSSGVLYTTYWVCAFSVNQHCTICADNPGNCVDSVTGQPYPVCSCGLPKKRNDSPPLSAGGESIECEVNKFDDMMRSLTVSDPLFEQVVAIDGCFDIFTRAWCVAELAAAHQMGMSQRLKMPCEARLMDREPQLRQLSIRNMQASRAEDKELILSRIPDHPMFDRDLQRLLFEDLIPAWQDIDALEKMRRFAQIARWHTLAERRGSVGIWQHV